MQILIILIGSVLMLYAAYKYGYLQGMKNLRQDYKDHYKEVKKERDKYKALLEELNETKIKNLGLFDVVGSTLLNELINGGEEVIAINGLRFTGTHEEKIKQVFDKYGIKYEALF